MSRGRSGLRKWLRWIATIVACVLVGGAFVLGSRPALSPQEIVRSATYQGEQQPRRIFNLSSTRNTDANLVRPHSAVPEIAAPTATDAAVLNKSGAAVLSNAEVPAAAGDSAAKVTRRTIPADVVVKVAAPRQSAAPPASGTRRMLPLYIVTDQAVQIRREPSRSSPSVKLLEQGTAVTLFSQVGDWAQVAANDGSGITGYVRSTNIRRKE